MTSEVEAAFPESRAGANTNQAGHTSTHHQGAQSHDCAEEDQRETRLETHSLEQLEFQDSSLSPGLPLLPTNREGERRLTEHSLFQQSGNEFVPLRPDPDVSTAPQNCTTEDSEHGFLSEYPLMQTTLLSEGEMSCSSLSQHSFSTLNEGRPTTTGRSSLTAARKESPPRDNAEPGTDPQDQPEGEAAEDEAFFLKKEVTAQHLLEVLQKDIGMSDSSGNVSSESGASGNIRLPVSAGLESSQTRKQAETPRETPCEVSLSQNQLSGSGSYCEPSEDSITMGPRGTRPDHSSEELHRQLLRETEQSNSCRGGTEHLGSLGNQTDVDGSYLGFLPQSQSTPGVFQAPPKSSIEAKAKQLSAIESSKENSSQSDAQSCVHKSEEANPSQEHAASAGRPSLPSVSYTQKVDAWRANQTSGKTSLLDSLALQGLSGSREKDAISDTPNGLPTSEKVSLQQPQMSVPARQRTTERSSVVPPGSPPAENDNAGRSKGPSALLSTASQSSSLSTVLPGRKDQGTRSRAENEDLTAAHVQREPGASAQPSALLSLGRFSDAAADHDWTLSTSQDSSGSGLKLATSVGASSVLSLEVDNYAPYWTSIASTPPPQQRSREFNIEERIPLYLQNLGINQSPSTILTPFVPRGPIREPEFSPTDFCTVKGSIRTPTKSIQAPEGTVMSLDSSISTEFSLESFGPGASIPEQLMQPPRWDPAEMQNQLPSSPQPEDSYPSTRRAALKQQWDSSLASSQKTIQVGDRFDSDTSLSTEGIQSFESSFRSIRRDFTDTSFVSSKPMLDIRNLLTQAENVSAGPYVASSATSHILSEENLLLERQEPSFSSSPPVGPGSQSSRLWAGSSSDSMLRSELRGSTAVRESMMSSQMPNGPSATASFTPQENSPVNGGAGPSFVLSQAVRRTEPEGCSAAPPDSAVPPQPAPSTSSAAALQQPPGPADTAAEAQAAAERPGQDVTSPPLTEDNDQGAVSDGSSGGSLTVKVSKLLQSDPPTTVASSASSMTDQEQRKASEWIKPDKLIQDCESLEMHEEDRRRIDEIKKELLLRKDFMSVENSETESSEEETSITIRDGVSRQTQWQQSHRTDPRLSASPLHHLSRPDLEAQIHEIAAREGVTLPRTNPRSFTSITIASRRRSSSSAPPELLRLSELSTDTVDGRPPPAAEAAFLYEPSSLLHQGSPGIQSTHQEAALLPPEDALTQLLPPPTPEHVSRVRLTPAGPSRTPELQDEGLGLAAPPGWSRNTEPMRQPAAEREDASTLDRLTSQDFTAAPPLLWPYKPKGSQELFYIPQREAELASSDTTMESSHPGSNDAVPPRFSSEVLGHGAPGISRGVTIRHTEGIYSRRLEPSRYQMQESEQRESTTQTHGSRSLQPSSPAAVTRATALRDWGTSSGRLPSSSPSELSHDCFQASYDEEDYESHAGPSVGPPLGQQDSSATLDQLWERFCARWGLEDSPPARDGQASLLERLERLSRLIHDPRGSKAPGATRGPEEEEEEQRRSAGRKTQLGETLWRDRDGTWTRAEAYSWRTEEPSEPATGSHSGPQRPAEGDERDILSTSGSVSTVDTARLVRVFGSHRVQLLKNSSSLRRLYSTIEEQRAGRTEDLSSIRAWQISQGSSVTAESASSSASSPPSHHGPSRRLRTAVRVANKGVQAGDLELVCSGTRRHTRDVGTTFPSPAEARPSRLASSSSSGLEGRGGGGGSLPSKTQRRRKSKKSPSKVPPGVSWFIPAEELGAEGRKENVHEEEETWRPGTSWFQPYSRIQPWREPLRQRQDNPSSTPHQEPGLRSKPASSAPAGWSLQEALVMRRPYFISESRQRLRRLAQRVEARKLQEVFSSRRAERFSRPGGAARQLHPAGNTRRAVPRKEMIQRSKQIYNNLPEVRKRREEERRREQYDSYRLKVQLYNKRITSRVLGRKTAWQ